MTNKRRLIPLMALAAFAVMALPAGASANSVKVSAGEEHVCAIKLNQRAVCWGDNDNGQAKAPKGKFKAIDAGVYHTCGILVNGQVKCWGANSFGQSQTPNAGSGGSRVHRNTRWSACFDARKRVIRCMRDTRADVRSGAIFATCSSCNLGAPRQTGPAFGERLGSSEQ
jgi:alpha-tubulin suppressor-like RCC1 family protein